jgi:sarcosine oxidase subunit gamma
VAELIAKTPCEGVLPLNIGALSLTEAKPGAMTSVAPFNGQAEALDKALQAAYGCGFPAPNQSLARGKVRIRWFGRGLALLSGAEPAAELAGLAALTDQSDAWAVVRLEGPGAGDVLARLVPVDLRPAAFPEGATVRSELAHMAASVTRTGAAAFEIMVFRSMAATLVHDLKSAMEAVVARG